MMLQPSKFLTTTPTGGRKVDSFLFQPILKENSSVFKPGPYVYIFIQSYLRFWNLSSK